MSRWILPPVAGLIEPVAAPQFYVNGIGAIELIGEHEIRLSLFEEQMPLEAPNGAVQKILNVRLLGQLANVPESIGHLALCCAPNRSPPLMPAPGVRVVK